MNRSVLLPLCHALQPCSGNARVYVDCMGLSANCFYPYVIMCG